MSFDCELSLVSPILLTLYSGESPVLSHLNQLTCFTGQIYLRMSSSKNGSLLKNDDCLPMVSAEELFAKIIERCLN